MQDHDWSRFLLRIPIQQDHSHIYKAWTTQDGLEGWFLRKAAFTSHDGKPRPSSQQVQKEDRYEWLWHGWPDEVVEKGSILEINHRDFLKFSFGQAGNVSITIRQEQGQVIVELLQDEIPSTEEGQINYHLGCTKGWLFYLTNLKSIMEGGLDLRNRDVLLKNVITS